MDNYFDTFWVCCRLLKLTPKEDKKYPDSIVSMVANDDQVIEGARASTAVMLTGFGQNIPV